MQASACPARESSSWRQACPAGPRAPRATCAIRTHCADTPCAGSSSTIEAHTQARTVAAIAPAGFTAPTYGPDGALYALASDSGEVVRVGPGGLTTIPALAPLRRNFGADAAISSLFVDADFLYVDGLRIALP